MIEVSDAIIEPANALEAFQAVAIESGAIVTFTGQERHQASGKSVKALHFQAYHPMTENGIHEAVTTELAPGRSPYSSPYWNDGTK